MRTFWTIQLSCRDCDGVGAVYHHRRGEDIECPYCDGAGAVEVQEPGSYYDDSIDVRADYPTAQAVYLEHIT